MAGGQVEGEGNHHRQHHAEIVVGRPAVVDHIPVDRTGNHHIVDAVDVGKLAKEHQTRKKSNPAEIVATALFPVDATGEQIVGHKQGGKLQKAEQQVLLQAGIRA